MNLSDITNIAAVLGSIFAIYIAIRKAPHEESSIDAGTAKTYEEAAALAGERANRLENELDKVHCDLRAQMKIVKDQGTLIDVLVGKDSEKEIRISYLEDENKSLIERVRILEAENGDLREWASRLVTQVKNLGGTPVQLRGRKS